MLDLLWEKLPLRIFMKLLTAQENFSYYVWYGPLKFLKSINIFQYFSDIKKNPDRYIPTDTFAENCSRFPYLIRYRYWRLITTIFTGCSFDSVNTPHLLHNNQFLRILGEYRQGNSARLEVAMYGMADNKQAISAINGIDEYRNIPTSMCMLIDGVNKRYPHIEAIRLLYLTGEINLYRYSCLFDSAKEADSNLITKPFNLVLADIGTNTDVDLGGIHIIPKKGGNEVLRPKFKVWAEYSRLFGSQYDNKFSGDISVENYND